jgi:hypothetical protein
LECVVEALASGTDGETVREYFLAANEQIELPGQPVEFERLLDCAERFKNMDLSTWIDSWRRRRDRAKNQQDCPSPKLDRG